jgi:hypothetical protein
MHSLFKNNNNNNFKFIFKSYVIFRASLAVHYNCLERWNRNCFRTLWQRSWLKHYATSRKVAGSSPGEMIFFFNLPNPFRRTVALGLTQPLTEMSTRNFAGEKRAASA